MSAFDDTSVPAAPNTNDNATQDPRTLARLQDEARVDQAGKVLEWGKNNLNHFDVSGEGRVNLGEVNLGMNTTSDPLQLEMLSYLKDHFPEFKSGKSGINSNDLQKHFNSEVKRADQNEIARQKQIALEQQQAVNRELMAPLMATPDGNPAGSLFRVLDTMRDRKPDDQISKRDLEKYLDEYARRVRTSDINSGQFNPQSRQFVEKMIREWDTPAMKQLRGPWRDSDGRMCAGGTISAKTLREAAGMGKYDDPFRSFVNADLAPRVPAPVVRAEMVQEITPDSNIRAFEENPRLAEQQAREAESQRIADAQRLREWGANNLGAYDITGDGKLNVGEVHTGIRTTPVGTESAASLDEIHANFPTLQRRDKVGMKELDRNISRAVSTYETNENSRMNNFMAERNAALSRDKMAPLFTNDNGHPNNSLFQVLDGINGDVDGKISKRDLQRFTSEYDWRSRNSDVGSGHYTPQNRAFVQDLINNWDSGDVKRLRGTYTVRDDISSRGQYNSRTREVGNSTISVKSLRVAAGLGAQSDLYALYRNTKNP